MTALRRSPASLGKEVSDQKASLDKEIMAERDRRMNGGMTFEGNRYQTRPEDRTNVAGAAQSATLATINNIGLPGVYNWHEPTNPSAEFRWILEDNSTVPLDAPAVIRLGMAMMHHKMKHIFAAKALKDAVPAPLDFTDDSYWP